MDDKFGEAISIAKSEAEKKLIYDKYICGEPEEIVSKLAAEPVLRCAILLIPTVANYSSDVSQPLP